MERHGGELKKAHVEDLPGLRQEGAVAVAVGRLDARDLGQGLLQRAAVVEPGVVGEVEAVPGRQGHQPDMLFQPFAEEREKFLEQEWRGDHRRPGVVLETVAFEDLGSTAQARAAVDERDLVALGAQPQGGGDSAEASADDDCFHD